jgi:Tfp pilus assembly protein PilF
LSRFFLTALLSGCAGLIGGLRQADASSRAASAAQSSVAAAQGLLEAWQLEAATRQTNALLEAGPSSRAARGLAAAVLHQHGCHQDANRLLADLPDAVWPDSSVRERIRGSAAYAPFFAERLTPHFSIRYLDKDRITATYAEAVLEAAYQNIGTDLQFFPAAEKTPIAVEIYPDAAGLSAASGLRRSEIATSGTIAICKYHRLMITSPLALYDGYPWADTLAHELTHLIIAKKSANAAPVWLHEGIAKFLETRWHGATASLTPYSANLLHDALVHQSFIPYAKMHPSMALLPSQDAAALAFAEVFTTVDYVVERGGRSSLASLLDQLRDGANMDAALNAVLGSKLGGLQGLEAAWKKWLKTRPFTPHPEAMPRTLRLRDAAAPPGASDSLLNRRAAGLTKAQQAVADASRLGELLELRGHPEAAWVQYAGALRLAQTPQPTLLWHAARLLVGLKQPQQAQELLRQLLAAQPEHSDANLLAGELALAGKNKQAARPFLEAARLSNPYNPALHAALRTLYSDSPGQAAAVRQEAEFADLCASPRPKLDVEAAAADPNRRPTAHLRAAPEVIHMRQLLGL